MSDTLTQLANKLRDIHFNDELGVFDEAAHERMTMGQIHNCHAMPRSGIYSVRFFLGGAYRLVGFSGSPSDAARFADMVRVRFHKYRVRGNRAPLTDSDLNFDLNQVEIDAMETPEALALIEGIEHLLLAEGVLKLPADRSGPDVAPRASRAKGDEILARLERIESLLKQFVALSKTT